MLSFRARGILAYLQANPDAPVNAHHLTNVAKEGYGACRTALFELEDAGFITSVRRQTFTKGQWEHRFYRTRAIDAYRHPA